jgi:hypothetical protein
MESRHLQGCSARLCRLRTNELVLTSKYWTYRSHAGVYGSSKPSSLSTTEAWLKLTASLVNSGEKLGTDPRSVSQRAVDYVGSPFFSGAVGSVQICYWFVKDCYTFTVWDTYGLGPYADWAWDACVVLVGVFSTVCTSIRIAATLEY